MIKSLVERMRLPRLGIIRLGVKDRNAAGKEYPKEVPHFVVPDDLRAVLELEPTRIPVLFPSDEPERVLAADYIRYQGKLLTLKCDGETYREIAPTGQEATGRCRKAPRERCPCGAEAKARLNVIVLDGPLGIYQVLIGGEQRIADLMSELVIFRQTLGRLTEILFYLERVPTEVQVKKEDGARLARTGWPVHIRCDFTAKQALRFRKLDVLGGQAVAALPAAPLEEQEHEGAGGDEEAEGSVPTGGDRVKATGTSAASGDERARVPAAETSGIVPASAPILPARAESRAAPEPASVPEEWTVEAVLHRAAYLGVPPGTLETYLEARFHHGRADLAAGELVLLGREMTAAEGEGKTGMAKWKLSVLEACKAAGAARRKAAMGVSHA